MATISQIKKSLSRIQDASNKLSLEIQKLSEMASSYLGFEVVADICSGDEIEFRPVIDSHGTADDSVVWRLEDFSNLRKEFEETGQIPN